jgi:hypothetical protein
MTTTSFKPSIHGWPFPNTFEYRVDFNLVNKSVSTTMGFCGGMCWLALRRFYNAVPIDRNTSSPQQGDPLYDDIFSVQKHSLPFPTILQIYQWQCSPDLSHRLRIHSMGHQSQQEWLKIRSRIDKGEPLTVTLIEASNDPNPIHLSKNHRVVAYAYAERPLNDGEPVHGRRGTDIRAVSLYIYDPNEPNDDDVQLTFYTNCEDNWIGLRHNRGAAAHGFFLDDEKA